MSEPNRCPECGTELPSGALGGLCPKCLLAAGLESREDQGSSSRSGAPTTPHSGSFVPPDPDWLAGHFPQLEILELLGHGGMGAVYKARQPRLDRLVALKIIRPESADDPAFAERFNREARMLARLSHPQIVAVYDFGSVEISLGETRPHAEREEHSGPHAEREEYAEPRTLYYFLMEYVDGTNLRQLMQSGELTPQQALAIVPQVCEALQFAHDEGVVHRDIKPENILLDKRGRVKIADFGLAKLAAASPQEFTLTGTHQVMGTPRYMAPEQMEGSRAVDHRADIYSLGVVFYEMLTGEVPVGHFEPPSKKVEVDVRLDEVVLRSLAREPERRYQQASDVKTDMESICSTPPPARTPGPQGETAADDPQMETARQLVQIPAIGLIVVGNLLAAVATFAALNMVAWTSVRGNQASGDGSALLLMVPVILALVALPAAIIVGGVKMLRLTSRRWAIAAAILALSPIPSLPLWFLSLPIGIWALVVLSRPDVKRGFAIRKQLGQQEETPAGRYPDESEESPADEAQLATARERVQWPVVGLLVLGMLGLPLAGRAFLSQYGDQLLSESPAQILFWLAYFLPPLATIVGAVKMLQLSSYRWAVAAGVLVMLSPAILEQRHAGWLWWLCVLVGIWSLVVLSKPEVKRGFAVRQRRTSRGPTAPNSDVRGDKASAAAKPRGTLGRAWDDWWAERDRWFTSGVQATLGLAFIVCLFMYLSFHTGSELLPEADGERLRHTTITYGVPDPWFEYESYPDQRTPFRWKIDWISSSTGIMLFGFVLWCINWQIEKAKAKAAGKKLRWWHGSPNFVIAIWGVATLAAVVIAFVFAELPAKPVRDAANKERRPSEQQAEPIDDKATESRPKEPQLASELIQATSSDGTPVAEAADSDSEFEKFYTLGQSAQQAFDRYDFDAAKSLAQEYLQLAEKQQDDWNYGNAIHDSNALLGRLAVAEGNLAAAKQRLLAAGKTTGSPQLTTFGPNLALAAELLARGEREAVLQYMAQVATVWRSPEKITRLVTTIQQGGTPPELNVVPVSHPLIGTWSPQEIAPKSAAARHAIEFSADGTGSLSIRREETQPYRVANSHLIMTNPATGREERHRFEFRDQQLVVFAPQGVADETDEIVFRRIGPAPATDSLVGTWEGTLHIEDVGDATIIQTFDSDEAGQATLQIRLPKPVPFFFSVVGPKMLWALEAESAASPAEWSIADDELTLTNFFLHDGETPSIYRRER